MKNKLLTLGGALALLATLGVFYAKPLMAQVRAALVSNVDDPGRIPYQATSFCQLLGLNSCVANFPQVLAGKRLVVTHVSGRLEESLPGGSVVLVQVGRLGGSSFSATLPTTFQGNDIGFNHFVFNEPELEFYDAGQTPTGSLRLSTGAPSEPASFVIFTFKGYMLDCSTGPCAAIAP
jgi:hypothetical protein